MLTAEQNRHSRAPRDMQSEIQHHIEWLGQRVAELETALGQQIRQSPIWREQYDVLQSVPGIGLSSAGRCRSSCLTWNAQRRAIAALVGVAPLNRDSGGVW
jgi:transposase